MALSKGHSQRAHALLSASGASRWMNCPPSARLEENVAEERNSIFANEGTLAHEFAEIGVKRDHNLMTLAEYRAEYRKLVKHKLYSPEMDEYIQQYRDYIKERFAIARQLDPNADILVEERIDLTNYIPEGFGSNDCIIIYDGLIEVIDLKYGKGVKVDADDNSQLKLYGIGALEAQEMFFEMEDVCLTIIQPRLDHISSWEISVEDLKDWGENVVKPKAKLAFEGGGDKCSGDWCRWCRVQARCPALAKKAQDLVKKQFVNPDLLTAVELIEAREDFDSITTWINAVNDHLTKVALTGEQLPGLKLVEGRSVRKWKDEEKVAQTLLKENWAEEIVYNKKIKGIGAIEKEMGKALFSQILGELIVKPQGKPTLVAESDKRKPFELEVDAKDVFKDELE